MIKGKSKKLTQVKSNQIIKVKVIEESSFIFSQKATSLASKIDNELDSMIKNDEKTSIEERHNEIKAIIENSIEDVFEQYNLSANDIPFMFKQIFGLIYFN